jgi:hypothetical protein
VLAAGFAGQSLAGEFEQHRDSVLRFFPPLWLREARDAGELEEGLTFENAPLRTVELLDLSDAG